jgi:hypothetical protein
MDRSLEAEFQTVIEDAATRIVAEDPRIQELVAWVLDKESSFEFSEDPDFLELAEYYEDRYGSNGRVLDRAMVICEDRIIKQEAYSDPDLQRAARRTLFMYGEPGEQLRKEYFELAQAKGLSEEEAWEFIANIETHLPKTED